MFSLIISIIAIALVAALALASIYYGGSAFQEGSTDAEASTVVNQGQQIQAAVTLANIQEYKFLLDGVADGGKKLVEQDYLKELPVLRSKTWVVDLFHSIAFVRLDGNSDLCSAIEERAGRDTTIDNINPSGPLWDTSVPSDSQFGCANVSGELRAYYKLPNDTDVDFNI